MSSSPPNSDAPSSSASTGPTFPKLNRIINFLKKQGNEDYDEEVLFALGKAADVVEMSCAKFLDVLHSQGIAIYECTRDDEAVNAYRQTAVKQ